MNEKVDLHTGYRWKEATVVSATGNRVGISIESEVGIEHMDMSDQRIAPRGSHTGLKLPSPVSPPILPAPPSARGLLGQEA